RVDVAIGTPFCQSISINFLVFASGCRKATLCRVLVSMTSPASPTYTNRPSKLWSNQPSFMQLVATQGVSLPTMLWTEISVMSFGAEPGKPDISNTWTIELGQSETYSSLSSGEREIPWVGANPPVVLLPGIG